MGGLRVHANGASSGFKDYSRLWPASQISFRHRGRLHAGVAAAKVCGGSAVSSTSESDRPQPYAAITSRRSLFLGRVIANFAKSNRVVAASRREQLYGVTAIKSSCYAGTTRLSSDMCGMRCDDTASAAHPSFDRVRRSGAQSDYSGATSASTSDVSRQRKQAAPCSGPTAAIAGTSSRQ